MFLLRAARLRRDEVAGNWWRGGREQSWLFAGIGQLLDHAIEVGLNEALLVYIKLEVRRHFLSFW